MDKKNLGQTKLRKRRRASAAGTNDNCGRCLLHSPHSVHLWPHFRFEVSFFVDPIFIEHINEH